MKILCICGARPNFMKIAAVVRAMQCHPGPEPLSPVVIHTGQHYDERLSQVMFEDLGLPRPDVDLEVGSASHAVQTAEIMKRFEPVVLDRKPDLVMVVGDVNSTVACSLVAVKLGIAVAHVEAGLRSFDRSMPEEINRLATDALSDLLFVSERSGVDNLRREGVPEEKIHFVGNVMIDTLLEHRQRAAQTQVLKTLGLEAGQYGVLTLHRPSNVDERRALGRLLDVLEEVAAELPLVFAIHPRTRRRLDEFGFAHRVSQQRGFRPIEPQGYLDFLNLMSEARMILTDSGGIQEEATVLRVPCLTLRENTERPATVETGYNTLTGTDPETIRRAFRRAMDRPPSPEASAPEKWDGRSGERIVGILDELGVEGLQRLQRGPAKSFKGQA